MMEAAGEARGKDSVLGVHVCVCSVQGHEGQAMFRVRVCVLGIAILFPCKDCNSHRCLCCPNLLYKPHFTQQFILAWIVAVHSL